MWRDRVICFDISLYDILASVKQPRPPAALGTLQILAEFRHQLRVFLQFSEMAARKAGLEPQQHQLLLQIAGAPNGVNVTVGYAAGRLGLRHHTVVELSNRCVQAGLIHRRQVGSDRRYVELQPTPKGNRLLRSLSVDHVRELHELAPRLIRSLTRLKNLKRPPGKRRSTSIEF